MSLEIDICKTWYQDVEFVMKQLMYEISLLEKEPQWVPAKWVKVIIVAMKKLINSNFKWRSFRIYTNIEIKGGKTEEDLVN